MDREEEIISGLSDETFFGRIVDEGSAHQGAVADYRNVSLLSSDQGRPQAHPDDCSLYPTVRDDIVQSKGLVREEEDPRNNVGKGCLKSQGNCEACQPRDSQSLKLGSDPRNYQDSSDGDYNPGDPDAIPYGPNELLGSACSLG